MGRRRAVQKALTALRSSDIETLKSFTQGQEKDCPPSIRLILLAIAGAGSPDTFGMARQALAKAVELGAEEGSVPEMAWLSAAVLDEGRVKSLLKGAPAGLAEPFLVKFLMAKGVWGRALALNVTDSEKRQLEGRLNDCRRLAENFRKLAKDVRPAENILQKIEEGNIGEALDAAQPRDHWAGPLRYLLYFVNFDPIFLMEAYREFEGVDALQQAFIHAFYGLVQEHLYNINGQDFLLEGAIAAYRRALSVDPDYIIVQYDRPLTGLHDKIYLLYANHKRDFESASRMYEEKAARQTERRQSVPNERVLDPYYLRAIGHFNTLEFFVKATRLGLREKAIGYLPYGASNRIANPYLLDLYKRQCQDVLKIGEEPSNISSLIDLEVNTSISKDKPTFFYQISSCRMNVSASEVMRKWDRENGTPILVVDEEIQAKSVELLTDNGFQQGDWFVCLHLREAGFRNDAADPYGAMRNVRVETYEKAIEKIVAAGGWVVRIGDPTMTPLKDREKVVDAALWPDRPDWFDVYLWSACRFYIGTQSGPLDAVTAFGKPRVLTNAMLNTALQVTSEKDVIVPKLMQKPDGTLLRFSEMLGLDKNESFWAKAIGNGEIAPVDCTESELEAAVDEMLFQLGGQWGGDRVTSSVQMRFDKIAHSRLNETGPVSSTFLEKYIDLLDLDV